MDLFQRLVLDTPMPNYVTMVALLFVMEQSFGQGSSISAHHAHIISFTD